MKRHAILAAAVTTVLSVSPVSADMPTIDISNLMSNIDQVYQQYQNVQRTIEQVQNTYKRIQQAAEMVKNMNFDEVKNLSNNFSGLSDNPFEAITAVRNSAADITKAVNRNQNILNNLRNKMNTKSITFGGQKVSMADLCGFGGGPNAREFLENGTDTLKKTAEKCGEAWEKGLSYKEKKAVWKRFGMSPRNYYTNQLLADELDKMVSTSRLKNTEEAVQEEAERLEAENSAMKDMIINGAGGSMVAQEQINGLATVHLTEQVQDVNAQLTKIFGLWGESTKIDRIYRQQEYERKQAEKERQREAERRVYLGDDTIQ